MFLIITIIGIYQYLKGNKYAGLMIFLFLLSDGFQLVPNAVMLFGLNFYGKDYALMFSVTLFFCYLITGRIKFPYKSAAFYSLLVFLIYLCIAAYVDLRYSNPSLSGFLLMFRVNFFLLTYFWLYDIDKATFDRIFKRIFIITVVQSVICLLQIPTGLQLLTGGGVTEFYDLGFRWIRFTNTPFFLLPCLFYCFLTPTESIRNKNYILALFLVVLFCTLTRTLILGLLITVFIGASVGLFAKQKKMLFRFLMIFILAIPLIGARIMSSTQDVTAAVSSSSTDDQNLTFAYRIFHATERLQYISETTKGKLFGIGFIHERDFPHDIFILGHKNDEGNVIQLDQADISWSNMFLRFGILGTILYLMIYLSFTREFFKNRRIIMGAVMFMFMIMSFLLSFSSGAFAYADYYVIPMIMFFYIRSEKKAIIL